MLLSSPGPTADVEDEIEYVVEATPRIRIEGALDVLVDKKTGSYHPLSVEKAR